MKSIGVLLLGVVLAAAVPNAAGFDSCLTGTGAAADTPVAGCTDKCVTKFDFAGTIPVIQERGCITPTLTTECEDTDVFCIYCNKDNCNNVTNLELKPCVTCDAGNDEACTTSPPAAGPDTGYVCSITSEVTTAGTVNARAALSTKAHLSDVKIAAPTKEYTLCAGANCNSGVFPLGRKQCETKTCLKIDDKCQAIYADVGGGRTSVSCSKEHTTDCDKAGAKLCLDCDITGCLDKLPFIKCHSCENDATCIKDQANSSKVDCKVSDIGCIVRITAGKISRNCQDSNDKCVAPGCKECATDSCNSGIFPVDRVACHTCSSEDDSCDAAPTGKPEPCLSTEDKCFTKIEGKKVTRGCVAEKPTESANCPSTSCDSCNSVTCSQKAVSAVTRLCHQCTKSGPGCDYEWDQTKLPTVCDSKVLEGAAQPQCYQYIRDDVRRGCATDTETKACADGTICKLCATDGCNKENVKQTFKCHKCSGANCDDVTNIGTTTTCATTKTECFTKVAGDGVVSRGCGADAPPVCEGLSCQKCVGSECNNVAVKETERQCYQCNAGDAGCDYELGKLVESTKCEGKFIVGLEPKCYQYIEDDVQRGCETDAEKACADGTLCTLCATNDCNKENVTNNFKCHTCTGDNCADVANGRMEKCAATETTCFTTVAGTNVTRGCAPKVEAGGKDCTSVSCTCLKSECNNVNVVNGTRTCYKCDKGNAACGGKVDEAVLKPELCLPKVIWKTEPKCYEFVKDDVKRGCANTLNAEDAAVCDAADKCKLCDSNGCNNNENSSATASGAMFLIIAAVMTSFAH